MPEYMVCPKCNKLPIRDCFGNGLLEPWCESCRRQYQAEYTAVRRTWAQQNVGKILESMGVPAAYRSCTFKNFEGGTNDQRRVCRVAGCWTKEADLGLFLCGPCGTGKTHLAIAALLELRARGFSGRYVSAQELLLECRDSFRHNEGLKGILEKISRPSVLLLDDLGAENPTPFARETIGLLIDRAYRDEQILIVTSNYDFDALMERLDVRTVDRLIDFCLAVKFTGPSYRQKRSVQRAALRNLSVPEMLQ